jgi:hypothetical protein
MEGPWVLNSETFRQVDGKECSCVCALIPPDAKENRPYWVCGVSLERGTWTEREETRELCYALLTKPGTFGVLAEWREERWVPYAAFGIAGDWLCSGWTEGHVHIEPLSDAQFHEIMSNEACNEVVRWMFDALTPEQMLVTAQAIRAGMGEGPAVGEA